MPIYCAYIYLEEKYDFNAPVLYMLYIAKIICVKEHHISLKNIKENKISSYYS